MLPAFNSFPAKTLWVFDQIRMICLHYAIAGIAGKNILANECNIKRSVLQRELQFRSLYSPKYCLLGSFCRKSLPFPLLYSLLQSPFFLKNKHACHEVLLGTHFYTQSLFQKKYFLQAKNKGPCSNLFRQGAKDKESHYQ